MTVGRILTLLVIVFLHVPVCVFVPSAAAQAPNSASKMSSCPCCNDFEDEVPSDNSDTSPLPQHAPAKCPCPYCSPVVLAVADFATEGVVELLSSESAIVSSQMHFTTGYPQGIERPPRLSS